MSLKYKIRRLRNLRSEAARLETEIRDEGFAMVGTAVKPRLERIMAQFG